MSSASKNMSRVVNLSTSLDSLGSRVIAVWRGLKQPVGLRDSSRWSKTTGESQMLVGTLKGCETSWIPFGQELAPLRGANHSPRLPEVFALLQPPATF